MLAKPALNASLGTGLVGGPERIKPTGLGGNGAA